MSFLNLRNESNKLRMACTCARDFGCVLLEQVTSLPGSTVAEVGISVGVSLCVLGDDLTQFCCSCVLESKPTAREARTKCSDTVDDRTEFLVIDNELPFESKKNSIEQE